jgi:hypothetical protein
LKAGDWTCTAADPASAIPTVSGKREHTGTWLYIGECRLIDLITLACLPGIGLIKLADSKTKPDKTKSWAKTVRRPSWVTTRWWRPGASAWRQRRGGRCRWWRGRRLKRAGNVTKRSTAY